MAVESNKGATSQYPEWYHTKPNTLRKFTKTDKETIAVVINNQEYDLGISAKNIDVNSPANWEIRFVSAVFQAIITVELEQVATISGNK